MILAYKYTLGILFLVMSAILALVSLLDLSLGFLILGIIFLYVIAPLTEIEEKIDETNKKLDKLIKKREK